MILERFFTPGLAQVAYLIGDDRTGMAAVIDPRRDIDAYLAFATQHELQIIAALETHIHADFVSGVGELAAATGATIFASRLGESAFPHHAIDDRDEIAIGSLTLRALWTPGHTPEHLSYLLVDPSVGPEPRWLFSGDALFVGEVGRPDLLGAEQTEHLAGLLYHTVVDRLSRLVDDIVVYPGHTAGSACGKKIGDAPHTTIGQEKRFNYAFQARSKDAFVRMVLTGMPKAPTYYPVLKRVNKKGAPLLRDLPPGEALAPDAVADRQAAGALVIDTRSAVAFGAGHVPGAIFAGLGPYFASWMGWIAPYDRELILVLDNHDRFTEARTELRRIGLDTVEGFLMGGMTAWEASGRGVTILPQLPVGELHARLAAGDPSLHIVDVRGDDEWQGGHISEAIHQFAGEFAQGRELPVNGSGDIAVICGSGYRSTVVASLLQAQGRDNLLNVPGGMVAWQAAVLPTITEESP